MDHRVASRIGQAQFQDVPVILVDELSEDLFCLFVETASWFPDETAQQTEHASDEHTADIEQLLREKKPFILPCMLDSLKKLQGRGGQWNRFASSVSIP